MPAVSKISSNFARKQSVLEDMQKQISVSALAGDYKAYKTQLRQYAQLAVENKDLLGTLKPNEVHVLLFSKEGFNLLKIRFLSMFRKRTTAEKELLAYAKRLKIEKKYF